MMIVRIQYCVDGTGGVKSKWTVYVHQFTLNFKNVSVEITWVSCFYLGYFKTWCPLQVCTFFKVYQLVHHVLKQPFLYIKVLWFLRNKKCSAYELSCYIYRLNYQMKFETYMILYLFIKTSSFHFFHRHGWNILKWNREDESLLFVTTHVLRIKI